MKLHSVLICPITDDLHSVKMMISSRLLLCNVNLFSFFKNWFLFFNFIFIVTDTLTDNRYFLGRNFETVNISFFIKISFINLFVSIDTWFVILFKWLVETNCLLFYSNVILFTYYYHNLYYWHSNYLRFIYPEEALSI